AADPGGWSSDHDHRRHGARVGAASAADRVWRAGRGAVRLLLARHPAFGHDPARIQPAPLARRDQGSARRQPVSLHRVREDPRRGRAGGGTDGMRVVGQRLPKVDAAAKVTGRAVYADDMLPARTLHCRVLRSPHPHARILSIDTSAARRMPGVIAVITGADLPIKFGILPVTQDERALEHEKVRYV